METTKVARAENSDDLGVVLEEREQIVEGEEDAGRDAGRDEGRDAARRSFIDVEPPTVRRKWLQLEQQAPEEEHQRGKPDRALDGRAVGDQIVDVQHAGHRIEEHGAEQKEGRGDDRRHEKLERCRQGRRRAPEAEQAICGDRDDLKETRRD